MLSDEQKREALRLIADRVPRKRVIQALNVTEEMWHETLLKDQLFANAITQTVTRCYDDLADELLAIPSEYQDIHRARLMSDNVKWLLSKRRPETYGDKLDLNVNHNVSIDTALTDAISRSRQVKESQELLSCGNHNELPEKQTDLESVDIVSDSTDEDIFS